MLGFLLLVNKNKNKKTQAFPFLCTRKKKMKLLNKYTTGRNFTRKEIFEKRSILLRNTSVADRTHKFN